MLLLFVASCDEKNKKTGYWVEYRDVIPDSLREQAFEAKYRMLSALPMSSDEDTRQVLMEVDYQVKQMYASNVLCLFRISYSGNMSYRDMIVPDRMTAEEKRIFQNLERAFHKRDKNE
jgi:hypothetical protein